MSKWSRFTEFILAGIVVDAAVYVAFYLWNWKSTKTDNRQETEQVFNSLPAPDGIVANTSDNCIHSVIFFPEERVPCRYHYERNGKGCNRNDCEFSHEAPLMDHLIKLLSTAKTSLDVCVYLITSYELCCAILEVHSRGVGVRIITDGNFSDNSNSKVGKFRSRGIPVRCNEPGFLMHHKFLLLDNSVLINGSFNWTWQAITGNNENLLVTTIATLVQPYVAEFDKLWKNFGKQ